MKLDVNQNVFEPDVLSGTPYMFPCYLCGPGNQGVHVAVQCMFEMIIIDGKMTLTFSFIS